MSRTLGFPPERVLVLVSDLVVWTFPHQRQIHHFALCGPPLPGEKMFAKGDLRGLPTDLEEADQRTPRASCEGSSRMLMGTLRNICESGAHLQEL